MSRRTRDLLGEMSRNEGRSISATVSDLADERWRAEALRSEREARRLDAASTQVLAEAKLWDETLEDGVD